MKIQLVQSSYQTAAGEHQVFAQDTDPSCSDGHQVLWYQSVPVVPTITVGTGE